MGASRQAVDHQGLLRLRDRRTSARRATDGVAASAPLERDLRSRVRGSVLFDAGHRAAYATDSSNYRFAPIGVVLPRDRDDLVEAVAVCREHRVPITPRGCGTGLVGATTNHAVIIDASRHLRRVLEIDPQARRARVQPGVVRDQLAEATEAEHHLTFMPDTSTHAYATFGGMIGANSCGVHSIVGGRTSDNVDELEVLLYDGTVLRVGVDEEDRIDEIVAAGGRKGEIYAALRDLRDRHADLIRERFPDIPRRVSGFNLDELLPERGFNVARALVGTEGTCATVLEATVRLLESPPHRALVVVGYRDIYQAADHVTEIREAGCTGLEALDEVLVEGMVRQGMHVDELPGLPEGHGWLLVEFAGWSHEEARRQADELVEQLCAEDEPPLGSRVVDDPHEMEKLWEIRESGLGATAYVPMEDQAWEGWEDAAVAPERLGAYLREWNELLEEYGYRTSKYGHFGDGLVHARVDFDLESAGGLQDFRSFVERSADLVVEHGGSLTGEHGDGQARGELLERMYGPDLVRAMEDFKAIWDPDGLMNPGKVVRPRPLDADLKLGSDYSPPTISTHFAYPQDGGEFAHAAMRCVGAGKCRDTSTGTMCPSYMATLDEQHTTRGRARILAEMIEGEIITDGFRSEEVHEALDLCLSCKGCKHDCPVNVDMATYKAEFLSKHYKRRLRPASAYTMGLIMFHARAAAVAPGLANALVRAPGLGGALKRAAGIASERELPRFARRTFRSWFAGRPGPDTAAPPVVLWADTFNDHFHPEVARAAVEVLEAAGRRVVVPQGFICCGRPLYDYGMLDTARLLARRLTRRLAPYARAGVPIVGLEPSCLAVLRDELVNLLPHDHDAKRISLGSLTLAEFLQREEPDWVMPQLRRPVTVHVHCHHQAVFTTDADRPLLDRLGADWELLDSGCCGMAGSFGFEADHYDVSRAVGERRLLPAVREAEAERILVSDGFSCKHQVEAFTDRRMLHTAQLVKMAMDHGEQGPDGPRPERLYPDR